MQVCYAASYNMNIFRTIPSFVPYKLGSTYVCILSRSKTVKRDRVLVSHPTNKLHLKVRCYAHQMNTSVYVLPIVPNVQDTGPIPCLILKRIGLYIFISCLFVPV